MNPIYLAALLLAVALGGYLLWVLLFPEDFS